MYRITSHVKVSIGMTTLFDDFELQAFEDELKHLIRDECKRAPEVKVRSITLRHSLCHMDCIKKQNFASRSEGRRFKFDHGLVSCLVSTGTFSHTFYATNTGEFKKCHWQKPQKHERRV